MSCIVATAPHARKAVASLAEIKSLLADPGDVRELGIVTGFND